MVSRYSLCGEMNSRLIVTPRTMYEFSLAYQRTPKSGLGKITHTRYPPEFTIKLPFSMTNALLLSRSAVADSIAASFEYAYRLSCGFRLSK